MTLDYQKLVDDAMLGIVKEILINTENNGLIDDQCFYISFRTDYPGVILSNSVKKRYPKEITIVLRYQFKDLKVMNDEFSVNISFGGVPEVIIVPFNALTGFVDPSVNFSLQFRNYKQDKKQFFKQPSEVTNSAVRPKIEKTTENINPEKSNIISIDQFRKKK